MAQVEFQYNGISTVIQCQEDQKMIEICNNFIIKSNINKNGLLYCYDGKGVSKFDNNITFNQMANSIDKQRKKMNILVLDNENINDNNKNIIKSKNIICPECGDNIRIEIKNFKIDSYECKNNHKINNMSINEFEKTQIIDLKNIICDICKERNKYDMHNNEFYKCYECNVNICPICKMQHNNTHKIYDYDKYKYICCKHNENLTNYCTECKMNICTICENGHLGHNQI